MEPNPADLIGTPWELAAVERLAADLYVSRFHAAVLLGLAPYTAGFSDAALLKLWCLALDTVDAIDKARTMSRLHVRLLHELQGHQHPKGNHP
jgi:hypothetical protein